MTTSNFTNTPNNTNTLQGSKFLFQILSLPNVNYFCQNIFVPGISTSSAMVSTPFSDINLHGDKAVFDPLTVTFQVDEDLRNWQECYDWIKGLTFTKEFPDYQKQKQKFLYRDATLSFLTNSNTKNLRFIFKNCSPISLSPIQMSTMTDASITPTCDLTLAYDYFDVERT